MLNIQSQADRVALEESLGLARSDKWPTVRKQHIEKQGYCMMCGGATDLQVHHMKPFHLHPELELDPLNLITLCEPIGIECHLRHGHLGNWKNFNPDILEQATSAGPGIPSQYFVDRQNLINKMSIEFGPCMITDHATQSASVVNRFFDMPGILSNELLPATIQTLGRDIGTALFVLQTPIRFRSDVAGGIINVPYGFISDLASIPKILQGIFMTNDDPRISAGAWVHDFLCSKSGAITLEDGKVVRLTPTQCAWILAYEAMPDLMANIMQQNAVYFAVKTQGPQW